MKRHSLLLLLFFCIHGIYAQVEFKAIPEKTTIGINETIKLDFSMNDDGDNFNPPSFKGFNVSGPTQAITGVFKKQTYRKIYTYYLTPTARGKFTIGQASIEIDGKIYKTIPFQVTVTAAVQNGNTSGNPVVNNAKQLQKALSGVELVAEVSNPNPYVNEPVNVVYKLYVRVGTGVRSWDTADNPQYPDFWSQTESVPKDRQQVLQGTHKGEMYNYVVVRKAVLYPQKSGRLELEPMSTSIVLEIPTGRPDAFGNDGYTVENKMVSTGKTAINVKPLPENGRPANFNGAVGSFVFKATSSKTTLANGESLKLDVSVTGKGNLKLFKLPKPSVAPELEMFDPEHKENISVTLSGMEGSMSDSYTVVPHKKGKFAIKGLSFSWFDPKLQTYRTMAFDNIMVDVLNVPAASAYDAETASSGRKGAPEAREPFRFIASATTLQAKGSSHFLGSVLFWILLVLPFLLMPVVVLARKKKEAYDSDVTGSKIRETNKLAKKYLAEAKNHLGDKEPFYMHLEKALHNVLKAKLNIETVDMSRQNVRELLLSRKVPADTVNDFIKIMDSCEFARYAPSSGSAMQQDYDNAVAVVTALEKQI
ncbi:BatD protein [Flavobacterium album]|uniref:BatD protein n=1 Tax=Flavobacterium album TaxID=2175091 RepID=A0A2S1QVC4_9FLAO|nr:BatD family protein [Flavobacterium album]AWH84336.1 BatD protein [Flavobacterium album]